MSSHTYPLHSGINLLKAAIKIAIGEGIEKELQGVRTEKDSKKGMPIAIETQYPLSPW